MADASCVLEYKCPCCNAGLVFSESAQKLQCGACGNSFDIEAVKAYNDTLNENEGDEGQWEDPTAQWSSEEQAQFQVFTCPSCGGEIMSDENTAATFCPYCENPAILRSRLSGGLKPDAVLPFQTTKEDAKRASLDMCKGKPLLPKMFTQEQRIEKITGIYIPFWLYDCDCRMDGKFKATKVHSWSDSRYRYTRTDHFLLSRSAAAAFRGIPMDGSQKIEDSIMESIEPFDYSQMVDFDTAYLSGFFADKYDVPASAGQARIRQRMADTMEDTLRQSCMGYGAVTTASRQVHLVQGRTRYVLLPVWTLHTQYEGKTYLFAMNGQTGKITGTLPICKKRAAAWFAGIMTASSVLVGLLQYLVRFG